MMVISGKRKYDVYLEEDADITVTKIRDKYEKKKSRKKAMKPVSKLGYFFIVGLSFILCTILLVQHTRINTLNNGIISLEAELKEVQMLNDSKEGSLLSSFDLDAIEKTAKEELGMVEPTPEQYTYLAVKDSSLSADAADEERSIQEARAEGSWFTRLID